MDIKVVFELGQLIKIKAHGITGIVNAIWVTRPRIVQYEVEWKDGQNVLKYRYFTEEELEKA